MQACSFIEKWHNGVTTEENKCDQVNFFIRKIFFWICLETIKTLEGCFYLLDTFLTLDGFKNCKVMVFKTKFDLNKFPQNLLDWCKNDKIDKALVNFLKICE